MKSQIKYTNKEQFSKIHIQTNTLTTLIRVKLVIETYNKGQSEYYKERSSHNMYIVKKNILSWFL